MCVVVLKGVAKRCGANIPGNVNLWVANMQDVDVIPDPDPGTRTISTDLTMAAAAVFKKYVFATGTARHTEPEDENHSTTGLLVARFDKDDAAKREEFYNMSRNAEGFTFIVEDGNGERKLVPESELFGDFDSGAQGADKNAWTIRLQYTGDPAFIYTGAIAE